ncbi:hypothetical protein D6783_05265 [Candidatus Woesearchaeota archaeon]|nr:MAG: hypothetical protein D6783_05265 [Candidatus Woesearchaeota archaeon]
MVSRFIIHKAMIKLAREIIRIISETSKILSSHDVSEQALTAIQQGVFDIATYTQKLFAVVTKDSEVEKEHKELFEKLDQVLKSVEDALEDRKVEPKLRHEVDKMDELVEAAELEEFEELKSDWRIQTHLKEVIDKLDVYKKQYLQFYATKRDELAVLMRELALHMTAVLKLLDIDVKEDKEIMLHLKMVHSLVDEAKQPALSGVWEKTGQKQYMDEVVEKVNEELKEEMSDGSS